MIKIDMHEARVFSDITAKPDDSSRESYFSNSTWKQNKKPQYRSDGYPR